MAGRRRHQQCQEVFPTACVNSNANTNANTMAVHGERVTPPSAPANPKRAQTPTVVPGSA